MEKKSLRKKDMLRMDGLLPPTRRVPVCNAVSNAPDKKKDKKWTIGGILRRISSIKDYDSSSNDEEIVYCKRIPRKPTKFVKQSDDVVLHAIENNSEHNKHIKIENSIRHTTGSPHSHRDSLHSRSSDGSLDGLGKKFRKNKLKARAEAKRDHLCADSSSDEDCQRSNGSLNRFHGADSAQNGQRSNMCNRKTRAARTERYIKRLSRDEGNGSGDTSNDTYSKKCPSEHIEDKERAAYTDTNGFCRPPIHPRRIGASNRTYPIQKLSAESLRDVDRVGLPEPEIFNDHRRYSIGQYATDLNQNNTYEKISRDNSRNAHADNYQVGNFFTYPAKNACHYAEPFDYVHHEFINSDNQPPEPPPRNPRYRVIGYGYSSYPVNRHQNVPNSFAKREDNKTNVRDGISRLDWRNFSSHGSNNEFVWRDTMEHEFENPTSNFKTEFRNSMERINNRYNSSRHCANESAYKEIEATRRRNTRNDLLNCSDANYDAYKAKNKSVNICESNKHHETIPSRVSAASSDWSSGKFSREHRISRSITPSTCDVDNRDDRNKKGNSRGTTPTEVTLDRRRSSRNLEEALSELEAIYNSLRLGDEDLLDRAERRSMEEYSLKQSKNEIDSLPPDSPDRTKDDMAYRRMHPKERPTSLSDIAGQSTLSNISYLIASPVLSRKDSAGDVARLPSTYSSRRDEPDVTRDDVLFRSINHANNTLRIIDPQPPFGIPLKPVTAATESDYLHTMPTKPEQPRSSYIPQCEPDVVTDDLAYRALRKDAGAARNVPENRIDVAKEQPVIGTCGIKKKRAVRSLSANLYGLINNDRIHLRREPSLDAIKDEIQDVTRNFAAMPERTEYFRRVVSDGELSDNDARRRKEPVIKGDTDINGNHPAVGAYRKKLRVQVSPEMTSARESPKKETESSIAKLSDVMLSSKAVLDDKFWHEYLCSDSNAAMANNIHSTETDFTVYSRLCQDLVNLIKDDGEDNEDANLATSPRKSDNLDMKFGVDESPTSIRSPINHYSGSQRDARVDDDRSAENENTDDSTALPTIANSTKNALESTPIGNNLDFYLRVADENVKLIAEAFGSVADRLRDNRFSARKNSTTSHSSEIGNQSGSRRSSSTLHSQDERGSDDRSNVSSRHETEIVGRATISRRDSWTSDDGDQSRVAGRSDDVSTTDAELDLSRAVRDLQLAAASLCEHGREIDDADMRRGRSDNATRVHNVTPMTIVASSTDEDTSDDPMHKIGLIAEAMRQERERDQEEILVPSSGIVARSGVEKSCREGESTVCEFVGARTTRRLDIRHRVTNLITVTITTYSMLLLACLLALLLAIIAAS